MVGEREGDRERERDHTAKVQGPLVGSTPQDATLTVGGHRCDTAAPLWRRAGSHLRWPAASEPHCLSQSLWDQRIPTQLALQTYRAQVVVIGDSLIQRRQQGHKHAWRYICPQASVEQRDTHTAEIPLCPVWQLF